MGGDVKYSDVVDTTGDSVVSCADRIGVIGDDMYTALNNLVSGGQLTGPGIAEALQESHARWDKACKEFAAAEQRLGALTKESYLNMMDTDIRAGGYF